MTCFFSIYIRSSYFNKKLTRGDIEHLELTKRRQSIIYKRDKRKIELNFWLLNLLLGVYLRVDLNS